MEWSVDGQTPEFLAATRMVTLSNSIVASILEQLKLEPGMRVLDVGCGSGEYCIRLGSQIEGVSFTGLEYDRRFVEFANKRAAGEVAYPFEQPNPANSFEFICGDGLDLPFEDGEFDAVISHTYLTALPDWAAALAEMCRVCKPGGVVSSVTSLTDDFYGTGQIALFEGLFGPEDAAFLQKLNGIKAKAREGVDVMSGIRPRKAPVAFDWIGLEEVRCLPIAQYFCLSDASVDHEEYERHVDLLRIAEQADRRRLMASEAYGDALTEAEWVHYEDFIDRRYAQLMALEGINNEWNWFGNSSLLVCGRVPEMGMHGRCDSFKADTMAARDVAAACAGHEIETRTTQLGPGRCVSVEFTVDDDLVFTVDGFDPPSALIEGYSHILNGATDEPLVDTQRKAIPSELVYSKSEMWETTAEASLEGMSFEFDQATLTSGAYCVFCRASKGSDLLEVHAEDVDLDSALKRALARGISALKRLED